MNVFRVYNDDGSIAFQSTLIERALAYARDESTKQIKTLINVQYCDTEHDEVEEDGIGIINIRARIVAEFLQGHLIRFRGIL